MIAVGLLAGIAGAAASPTPAPADTPMLMHTDADPIPVAIQGCDADLDSWYVPTLPVVEASPAPEPFEIADLTVYTTNATDLIAGRDGLPVATVPKATQVVLDGHWDGQGRLAGTDLWIDMANLTDQTPPPLPVCLPPTPPTPPAPQGPVDPGSARETALNLLPERGWDETQWACLDNLWHRESGWRWNATNRSSGAYGIPQALPATKMGAAGDDWQTNPETQIRWGLSYIAARYGTPCAAWQHFTIRNWY